MHAAIVGTISLRSMRLFYDFWILKFAPLFGVCVPVRWKNTILQSTYREAWMRTQSMCPTNITATSFCRQKWRKFAQKLWLFFIHFYLFICLYTQTTKTRDERKWQINSKFQRKIRTKTSWRHHKMQTTMIMDGFVWSTQQA